MQVNKKADFVLKGNKVVYPLVRTDGLKLYYDTKGKKNGDKHKDKLLDMSGQGKDGELSGFDYDGGLSGYDGDNGLVFDGIDDTLTMPKLSDINPNNFTYQLNNNILTFTGDEVKTVKNGSVEVVGRNLALDSKKELIITDITPTGSQQLLMQNAYVLESDVEQYTTYTISINFRGIGTNATLRPYVSGTYRWGIFPVTNKFTTHTATITTGTYQNPIIHLYGVNIEELEIAWIKIEKGSKATTWTPAPEDILEATELKGNILGDMEDIVDASPRDRQSGEEVFTEHADDSVVHVEVDGKSVQGDSTNLFDFSNTFTNVTYPAFKMQLKPYTKYTASTDIPLRDNGTTKDVFFDTNETSPGSSINGIWYGNPRTITTDSTGVVNITTRSSGDSTSKTTIDDLLNGDRWVRVEEGSTASPFNGYGIPTPENPIEISSLDNFSLISGKDNYGGFGENLVVNPDFSNGVSGWVRDGVELEVVDGIAKAVPISGGKRFYSSYSPMPDAGRFALITVVAKSDNGAVLGLGQSRDEIDINLTDKFEKHTVLYRGAPSGNTLSIILKDTGVNYYFKEIKVQQGSRAVNFDESTEYEDNDKINISLSEPLRSVGDVKDRLFRDSDGLWKIERNVGEVIFNGTESWRDRTNEGSSIVDVQWYQTTLRDASFEEGVGLSSHFQKFSTNISNDVQVRISEYLGDMLVGLFLPEVSGRTDVSFRESLVTNPITLQLVLTNPTIETLDQDLQDKLNTLKSFKESNYVYTVQNMDNTHKEQLKPTLHATFNSKDYLKETRTLTNLLIWIRELSDEELIHHNQLFLNRFNLPSDRVIGEPIEQTLNLLHGGMVGHSLEQNYTINI